VPGSNHTFCHGIAQAGHQNNFSHNIVSNFILIKNPEINVKTGIRNICRKRIKRERKVQVVIIKIILYLNVHTLININAKQDEPK
jgi:hypothetical protein